MILYFSQLMVKFYFSASVAKYFAYIKTFQNVKTSVLKSITLYVKRNLCTTIEIKYENSMVSWKSWTKSTVFFNLWTFNNLMKNPNLYELNNYRSFLRHCRYRRLKSVSMFYCFPEKFSHEAFNLLLQPFAVFLPRAHVRNRQKREFYVFCGSVGIHPELLLLQETIWNPSPRCHTDS